jgi:hypothetical protein
MSLLKDTTGKSMNSTKNAQEILDNFDDFFLGLAQDNAIKIALDLEVSDTPIMEVKVNSKEVYHSQLESGNLTVELTIAPAPIMQLDISMLGKTQRDTVLVDNKIVKDKFIIIKRFLINNFDLLQDHNLFYSKFIYLDQQNNKQEVKAGFWANNTLRLEFTSPFTLWYALNSSKNTQISQSLHYRDNQLTDQAFTKLSENVNLLE